MYLSFDEGEGDLANQCGGVSGQSFSTSMPSFSPSNSSIALNCYFLKSTTFNSGVNITKEACLGKENPINYLSCGYVNSVSASASPGFTSG